MHYLKQTKDRGLALNHNSDVGKVGAYPDANLDGMYGHEKHIGPACIKSCTLFIITFSDYPVLWVSKLHTETDLSTMEAEIKAMNNCCR